MIAEEDDDDYTGSGRVVHTLAEARVLVQVLTRVLHTPAVARVKLVQVLTRVVHTPAVARVKLIQVLTRVATP